MATPQTEIELKALELATEALEAFCEDMSGMFDVEMGCEQQEIEAQTVAGLKKRFKKLVAINIVDSEGALDGTFQVILDQEGLFTLGGVMVMLPEKRILANRKDASADLAESMVDAVGEAGNLLVGAWERIFREELEGHGHLVQRLPAYVGKPWSKPQDTIGLARDEELVFIPYEMTIAPYPAFKCGVIFPKTIFEGKPGAEEPEAIEEEPEAVAEIEKKPEAAEVEPEANTAEEKPESAAKPEPKAATEPEPEASAEPEPEVAEEKPEPAAETPTKTEPDPEPEPEASAEPELEVAEEKPEPEPAEPEAVDSAEEETAAPAESKEPAMGPVSEAIQEMSQSPSAVPSEPVTPALAKNATFDGDSAAAVFSVCAKDIMQDQVVWASPEDSVQEALAKMQQHGVGYVVVGQDGALEGILSKSDAAGAISPYLRPLFAKWRRPSDDATLKIKIKHVMSRPVRTTRPETPLATIMENMCRFSGRVLPVVDEQGKVHGLVTAFGIFQMLLNAGANVPTVGKARQGPPL